MSDLTWLSTRELAARIAAGEVSAREATQDHLDRIAEVNPALNAIVTVDAEGAMERATAADERFAAASSAGEKLPPLHGVPMTHKDTHDVAGMRSTLGSLVYADRVPDADDPLIGRLRAAGVIATGKSNVPEFGAGAHTFNSVFGTTVNPYDTSKSVAGSSGGVGAALASGIQASGDGSDMGGSLRTPASFNNVVGMRPSHGRIPRVLPANPYAWLTQQGFMARTVADVALLLSIGAGPQPAAPSSLPESGSVFDLPEFALGADHQPSLAGVRVGVSADLAGLLNVESEVADTVTASASVFDGLGAAVDAESIDLTDADEVFTTQRAYDFVALWGPVVESDDAREGGRQIKDAIHWNAQLGRELTIDALVAADAARTRLAAAVHEYFTTHDVLVTTTAQVLPFDAELEYPQTINGEPMDNYLEWMRAVTLISATGCPAISVPGGFSSTGLPIGIHLVAAPGRDVDLLRYAHAFEAVTNHGLRRPAL